MTVHWGMKKNIFKVHNKLSPPSSELVIVNYETRRRSDTLKGSQRMGDGRIFLKTFRATLFDDDLSNESDFGLIHLAGQTVPLIIKELGLKDRILCLGFIPRRTGWGAAAPHTRFSVPAVRRSLSGSAPNQTPDFMPRIVLKKRFSEIFFIFNERKLL